MYILFLGPKRQQRDLQVPNHSFREQFFLPLFLLIAGVIRRVFVSVTAAIVIVVRGYMITPPRDARGSGGIPPTEVPWQLCERSQQRSSQDQCLERFSKS